MTETNPLICPNCGNIVVPTDAFCGHCGVKLGPQTIGFGRQMYIYLMSLLLPPFGLIWTFKYIKDPNIRYVGLIAGIITIISLIFTAWVIMGFFAGIQNQLNSYSSIGL